MASLDYIFQGAPATGSVAGAIPSPGTKLAPSVGLDVTNNVGYLNVGSGWIPQVPAVLASKTNTALSATQTTATLFTTPSHMSGLYRVSFSIKQTTVDSSGVSMGVFTVQYTSIDGQATTAVPNSNAANVTNDITHAVSNSVIVDANGGTAMTYTLTYTPTTGDGRASSRIRVEYLG